MGNHYDAWHYGTCVGTISPTPNGQQRLVLATIHLRIVNGNYELLQEDCSDNLGDKLAGINVDTPLLILIHGFPVSGNMLFIRDQTLVHKGLAFGKYATKLVLLRTDL